MKYAFFTFLTLLLGTFYHRINHYDEAWLAEQAYWLVHDGRVRSELFCGLNGWEDQLFIFHKGFIYLSALWQQAVGFTQTGSKTFSALWFVGLGTLLWGFMRQQRVPYQYCWLALLLYVANGLVIEFSFVYRPEMMCVTIGFASFWLLMLGHTARAGLVAGLAAFAHLNGLTFVVAGGTWLLWQRQPRQAFVFGLMAGFVCSLYFVDVWQNNGWAMLWLQWQNEPALLHIRSFWDKLRATLHGLNLFRLTAEMGLLALGTYWLTGRWAASSARTRAMETYLLLLVGAHLVLTRSSALHYALQFAPFICVLTALRVAEWPTSLQTPLRLYTWRGLLCLYLLAGLYRDGLLTYRSLTTPGVAELNAHMAALIGQPGSEIMAPVDFFYEQIGHYRIRCIDRHLGGFFAPLHSGVAVSDQQIFQMAEREGYVAVITYDGKGPDAPLADTRPFNDSLARFGPYVRVYQDRWNSLYLKQ